MINEAIEGSVTATTNGSSSGSGLKNNAVGNNNLSSSISNNNYGSGGIECRLCEPGNNSSQSQKVLKNNVDLYQHLSEVHFCEKLLEEVLKPQVSASDVISRLLRFIEQVDGASRDPTSELHNGSMYFGRG